MFLDGLNEERERGLLQTLADVVAVRNQMTVLLFARHDALLAKNVRTLVAPELDCFGDILAITLQHRSHSAAVRARYDLSAFVEWKIGFFLN